MENEEQQISENTESDSLGLIKFRYTRSNFYREVVADGAYGALKPDLDIHMSFYNQHTKDFREQLFELNPDGTLGAELLTDDSSGMQVVDREVEVGITINIETAIRLIRWLRTQVLEAQKIAGIEVPKNVEDKATT